MNVTHEPSSLSGLRRSGECMLMNFEDASSAFQGYFYWYGHHRNTNGGFLKTPFSLPVAEADSPRTWGR